MTEPRSIAPDRNREDAQQTEGGQHFRGQQQEETIAHARRQRSRDHEPQGRPRDPGSRHAQQAMQPPYSREETAFTTRFSFRGTRRRNSSTTRMLTAMKAMSNVR